MSNQSEPQPQAEAPDDQLPKEGDLLAGKYRIERVIGQGGMAMVFAAQHTTLRQRVAVKLMLPEAAKRNDSTERFLREARAAIAIQSEHVARVMDVGTLDNGSPYMVMEYLNGIDLGALLSEQGVLSTQQAVDYILQACEAIAEAHSIGIIHRDLKPANLFLSQRADGSPLIKVLDFGLSKVTKPDTLDASLTAANVVMGSPCYMSPEQIRSLKGLDARTDMWALGVILYQILTGSRPFEAASLGALFFTIGADPPAPLRSRRADIPPGLEAAVLKCLEKDPTVRTQTVAELARMLAPFGSEESKTSVERIHRVLSDPTPFTMGPQAAPSPAQAWPAHVARRSSVSDGMGQGLPNARPVDDDDNEPTLAAPPKAAPPPAVLAPPETPPPVPYPVAGPYTVPPRNHGVKSGSMAAIAKDGPLASIPPPAASATARTRSGIVAAVVGVAALAVVGVTFIGLRAQGGSDRATPAARNDPGADPAAAMPAELHATATPAPAPPPAAAPATAAATTPTATTSASAEPSAAPMAAPKPTSSAVAPLGSTVAPKASVSAMPMKAPVPPIPSSAKPAASGAAPAHP